MSILIKGMKMPKNCHECGFKSWTHSALKGSWFCPLRRKFLSTRVIIQGKRYSDCPLVEIPPHERLIDADRLSIQRENYDTYNDYSEIFDMIDNAPTVIKSEEE